MRTRNFIDVAGENLSDSGRIIKSPNANCQGQWCCNCHDICEQDHYSCDTSQISLCNHGFSTTHTTGDSKNRARHKTCQKLGNRQEGAHQFLSQDGASICPGDVFVDRVLFMSYSDYVCERKLFKFRKELVNVCSEFQVCVQHDKFGDVGK